MEGGARAWRLTFNWLALLPELPVIVRVVYVENGLHYLAVAYPVDGDLFAFDPLPAAHGGPVDEGDDLPAVCNDLTENEAEGTVRDPLRLPDHSEYRLRTAQLAGVRVAQIGFAPDYVGTHGPNSLQVVLFTGLIQATNQFRVRSRYRAPPRTLCPSCGRSSTTGREQES